MSLTENTESQRKTKNLGLFRLISLSEIKPKLCVSALSSEAGEIQNQGSQRVAEATEKKIKVWWASPKNQK